MSVRNPVLWVFFILSALFVFLPSSPVWAQDSADSAAVDRVIEDSKKEIMAPCCWKDTLMNHSSPRSDELSAEVRKLAEEGKSKDEILNIFAERYGETILARPRTEGIGLLFYLVPAVLLLLTGLWLGGRMIPKLATPDVPEATADVAKSADNSELNEQFEAELERHRG